MWGERVLLVVLPLPVHNTSDTLDNYILLLNLTPHLSSELLLAMA